MNNNSSNHHGTKRVTFTMPVKKHSQTNGAVVFISRDVPEGLRKVKMSLIIKSSFAFSSYFLFVYMIKHTHTCQ